MGIFMDANQETVKSVTGRLNVLRKGLVSEGNSVQYYQTLMEKTPEDSEENIGARRMYEELMHEEEKHVQKFEDLIRRWEEKLKELEG